MNTLHPATPLEQAVLITFPPSSPFHAQLKIICIKTEVLQQQPIETEGTSEKKEIKKDLGKYMLEYDGKWGVKYVKGKLGDTGRHLWLLQLLVCCWHPVSKARCPESTIVRRIVSRSKCQW